MVTEQCGVGENERAVLRKSAGLQVVFVNKVEHESAVEQNLVHALQVICDVTLTRNFIERIGALRKDDSEIRD